MIRKQTEKDIDQIMNIWYKSSTLAHPFLNSEFVEKVKKDMRNIYIPNADTWVFEENDIIYGFISMIGNEIGGLFVLPNDQSRGIGTQLVDFIKKQHKEIEVEVFEKNNIGRSFYNKYGFELINKSNDKGSGENVLRLISN